MAATSILFVCLGNICRSPLAEGVFRALVEEKGEEDNFVIDSCGTGSWHVGNPPHAGSREIAKKHGVSLAGIRARQIKLKDLKEFDIVVTMDRSNLDDVLNFKVPHERLFCLREYDRESEDLDVPDPYYTGDFEGVYQIIERSCKALLADLTKATK